MGSCLSCWGLNWNWVLQTIKAVHCNCSLYFSYCIFCTTGATEAQLWCGVVRDNVHNRNSISTAECFLANTWARTRTNVWGQHHSPWMDEERKKKKKYSMEIIDGAYSGHFVSNTCFHFGSLYVKTDLLCCWPTTARAGVAHRLVVTHFLSLPPSDNKHSVQVGAHSAAVVVHFVPMHNHSWTIISPYLSSCITAG